MGAVERLADAARPRRVDPVPVVPINDTEPARPGLKASVEDIDAALRSKNRRKKHSASIRHRGGEGEEARRRVRLSSSDDERECPPAACPAFARCPHEDGQCCRSRRHCCPKGHTCLATNPPSCVLDPPLQRAACFSKTCKAGFRCPHKGVRECCKGGESCCPVGYRCGGSGGDQECVRMTAAERAADLQEQAADYVKEKKRLEAREAHEQQRAAAGNVEPDIEWITRQAKDEAKARKKAVPRPPARPQNITRSQGPAPYKQSNTRTPTTGQAGAQVASRGSREVDKSKGALSGTKGASGETSGAKNKTERAAGTSASAQSRTNSASGIAGSASGSAKGSPDRAGREAQRGSSGAKGSAGAAGQTRSAKTKEAGAQGAQGRPGGTQSAPSGELASVGGQGAANRAKGASPKPKAGSGKGSGGSSAGAGGSAGATPATQQQKK